jgi:hypothetical protein
MTFENFRQFVLKKMSESKQNNKPEINKQPYQSAIHPLKQENSIPKGGCCGKRAKS